MIDSIVKFGLFSWLCIKEAAHGTIERANAWFWLIGVPLVWIGGRYWEVGELTIPDNTPGFLTFMIVTGAVTWAVFFLFRLVGAPSRLYWQERDARTAAESRQSALEILFDPRDTNYVRPITGLHGQTGEFFSIGIRNPGNTTIYDITVRALDSWFTRTAIAEAALGQSISHHYPVSIIQLAALHPHAPEIVQVFGISYHAASSNPEYIYNTVQRFTLEASAKDTPSIRKEFEYDPKARPMLRMLG